jgi:catalase
MFWDFISLRPETIHQVTFLFSNRGTPDGYRHMNGYGSHAYINVNDNGDVHYVKYHFKTDQGVRNLSAQSADQLAGTDPDYATRDLFNAIQRGDFPAWTMYVQVMTEAQAATCPFNPFDLTKIWPHGDYPLHPVGRIVLNENPSDYFTQVEQLAFSPSHLVPGIYPSPDKMLQARLFSYPDTQRHRLGANYVQLPCNNNNGGNNNNVSHTYQRDGPMAYQVPSNGLPNYYPNSIIGSPQPDPIAAGVWPNAAPIGTTGPVGRYETGMSEDNFGQCRTFYQTVLMETERDDLTTNMAGHLHHAKASIRQKVLHVLRQVDDSYADAVEQKMDRILSSPRLEKTPPPPAPLNPPRNVAATTAGCPYALLRHQQSKL